MRWRCEWPALVIDFSVVVGAGSLCRRRMSRLLKSMNYLMACDRTRYHHLISGLRRSRTVSHGTEMQRRSAVNTATSHLLTARRVMMRLGESVGSA